ncbi:MAG: molybdopterin molybdotransferase MoeA [Methermicoccaceae archaeon]
MQSSFSNRVSLHRAVESAREEGSALRKRLGSEKVPVWDSFHRVLAADVQLQKSLPLWDFATMDGFAINTASSFPMKIVGSVYAGDDSPPFLHKNEGVRVATGAPLPSGANAVVKNELAHIAGSELLGPPVKEGSYVLFKGTDVQEGDGLEEGSVLDERAMALIASCTPVVEVVKMARVGVLSSGKEILTGVVPDTNAPLVCGMLRSLGAQPVHLGVLPDEPEATQDTLERVCDEVDMLITMGGASVGERDYVWRALERTLFRGVGIRPGKPLTFGYLHDTPVLCLPGKPVGAYTAMRLVGAHLFCTPKVAVCSAVMGCSVRIPADGFQYVLYGSLSGGTFEPVGIVKGKYNVSVASAMLSGIMCDGYVPTDCSVEKGESVDVFLM